jgi:hypothetical protein
MALRPHVQNGLGGVGRSLKRDTTARQCKALTPEQEYRSSKQLGAARNTNAGAISSGWRAASSTCLRRAGATFSA